MKQGALCACQRDFCPIVSQQNGEHFLTLEYLAALPIYSKIDSKTDCKGLDLVIRDRQMSSKLSVTMNVYEQDKQFR